MAQLHKGIAGLVLLLSSMASLAAMVESGCQYFTYSYFYNRYICLNSVQPTPPPRRHINVVPMCTEKQSSFYWVQQQYQTCCGPNVYVTNGNCCSYSARYTYSGYGFRNYNYCMCSPGIRCSTTDPSVNPVVPIIPTPNVPNTTPTTTMEATTKPTTATPTTATPTTPTTTPTTQTMTTPTTPTTTSPKPTTTAKPLCPTYRLLNSEAADECNFPGITSIERDDGTPISTCNAVLVPAHINGVTKPAFFTTNLCRQQLKTLAIEKKINFNFKIGGRSFPIDMGNMFDIVDDPTKGSSFFVIKDRFASLFNLDGNCQHPACVMSKDKVGKIDYGDCEVVGYGSIDPQLNKDGLRKVKVHVTTNDLCAPQSEYFHEANTMCFTTASGENLFCANDSGASVFCKAKTGEKVMIGGAAFQPTCDTSPSFRLIPYPVTELTPVPLDGKTA